MIMPRYRTIRHTADKAIYVWGETLPQLFENAAYGTFSLIADISRLKPEISREVDISNGGDISLLLVDWLSELLYIFDTEKILFCKFKVNSLDEKGISSTCEGVRIRPGLPWRGSYVKAVTYHNLEVERTEKGYRARIFFDV